MFQRIGFVGVLCLLCAACGGSVDSHDDAMAAQIDLMEEMIEVLEGVTDEASADAAIPDMQALGKRGAEIAAQVKKLPQPSMKEMQAVQKKHAKRMQGMQQTLGQQFQKLAKYPKLGKAATEAMSGMK